jgi:hypothetical protein
VAIVTKGWIFDAGVATVIAVAAFYGAYQVAVRGLPYLATSALPRLSVWLHGPDAGLLDIGPEAHPYFLASIVTLITVIGVLSAGAVLTRLYLQRRGRTSLLPCSKPVPPGYY